MPAKRVAGKHEPNARNASLGHQTLPKSSELSRIQRLSEETGNLQYSTVAQHFQTSWISFPSNLSKQAHIFGPQNDDRLKTSMNETKAKLQNVKRPSNADSNTN